MENQGQDTGKNNRIKRWLCSIIQECLLPFQEELKKTQETLELLHASQNAEILEVRRRQDTFATGIEKRNNEFQDQWKNSYIAMQKELLDKEHMLSELQREIEAQKQCHEKALSDYENRLAILIREGKVFRENLDEASRNFETIKEEVEEAKVDFNGRLFRAEENVRANNRKWESLGDYGQIPLKIKENTELFDKLANELELLRIYVAKMFSVWGEERPSMMPSPMPELEQVTQSNYQLVDYFDFENHFRGNREDIKKRQEIYLPYMEGKKNVFDLGCGRGEFLELLGEHGVRATGVDSYPQFVKYCQSRNLSVILGDALEVLSTVHCVDGIFAGQLVEHLTFQQIQALCTLSFEKLTNDGYIILETPNPMSLAIYTHAFYMDPSHNKPVHPLTLQYLLQKCGFRDVQILFLPNSRLPIEIPELYLPGNSSVDSFNQVMKEVSKALFGSQDYAVIAQK